MFVNPDGLHELLTGPGAAKHLTDTAKALADEAERLTPVGSSNRHAAETLTSTGAEIENGELVARAGSTYPFWHLIEFGSVNNPPYRPLTRAAENLGLDFTDSGKP